MLERFRLWLKSKHIDAITLGGIAAVSPLVGDMIWWYHDVVTNGFHWRLGIIGFIFSVSTTLAYLALIFYAKEYKERRDNK